MTDSSTTCNKLIICTGLINMCSILDEVAHSLSVSTVAKASSRLEFARIMVLRKDARAGYSCCMQKDVRRMRSINALFQMAQISNKNSG
jgi:hypothetical protein